MKDKEQTKRKLIYAVGVIVKAKGFSAVSISKVAREAGVDRKLVYRYFGNMNNLTEAYISEKVGIHF
jgi:AcrR family transcriptional regulator